MDIFEFRENLIKDYADYLFSFIHIKDPSINDLVEQARKEEIFWPEPLLQLNPRFKQGKSVDELVEAGYLHERCKSIFRVNKSDDSDGERLQLHLHQEQAIINASKEESYVLTTGTGSGKSLTYIIPIVNHVLQNPHLQGIQALIIYPMNALANSQEEELKKFLCGQDEGSVTFKRYTGQESHEERIQIINNPPHILLTNYVMLELMLTRPTEIPLIQRANSLKFLVLDELHTYRGRQGSDVSLLMRRLRDRTFWNPICVGTSATLAGSPTLQQQQREVSDVASRIFGVNIHPQNVISETLTSITNQREIDTTVFLDQLRNEVQSDVLPQSSKEYLESHLSVWLEQKVGLKWVQTESRWIRQKPLPLLKNSGIAKKLSNETGINPTTCLEKIKGHLLHGYHLDFSQNTIRPFTFRLHQFLSRGESVWGTLESINVRDLTLKGQQFSPNKGRGFPLYPIVFCRECGQEYYCVHNQLTDLGTIFRPRNFHETSSELDEAEAGYLYHNPEIPWPIDDNEIISKLPSDWVEVKEGIERLRQGLKERLPVRFYLNPEGLRSEEGVEFHYIKSPFRFCLNCGVSYIGTTRSDIPKLADLSFGGRSTSTTLLSLSSLKKLRNSDLEDTAKKVLSFTDNRQDASLQSGHFNDFVNISLLRSALNRILKSDPSKRFYIAELPDLLISELDLNHSDFCEIESPAPRILKNLRNSLRQVIEYRLLFDLRRGWRLNMPNLEQCGLLIVDYDDLDTIASDDQSWENRNPVLLNANSETREKVLRVLMDLMRRWMAVDAFCFKGINHQKMKRQSERLIEPWTFGDRERLFEAPLCFPRGRRTQLETQENRFISGRSTFARYLRRNDTFPDWYEIISAEDCQKIITDMFDVLFSNGLLNKYDGPDFEPNISGYQIPSDVIVWKAADGTVAAWNPVEMPNLPTEGRRINPFFLSLYQNVDIKFLKKMEGREHTAQVPGSERENREKRFGNAELPLLFCSPTMELGVDIKTLNVVNMRNVPPTPANYAQRSGRAGRQGQPAIVYTYCSAGSPHDQFFFDRSDEMVSGLVQSPRLDLSNEELIKSHLHAIWLAETGADLQESLSSLLKLENHPEYPLKEGLEERLSDVEAKEKAEHRAKKIMLDIIAEFEEAGWYSDNWIQDVLNRSNQVFYDSCNRWIELYKSARTQAEELSRVELDPNRSRSDKNKARSRRSEALSQMDQLTKGGKFSSDFYSYRYFASEGFLPGYNFPRLPLSAFIPGKISNKPNEHGEYIQRPRFLAISEFGPRAIVYHEGNQYVINKVILPPDQGEALPTREVKICSACGHYHQFEEQIAELCNFCGAGLGESLKDLFHLQNVSTYRRNRITCDEEERMKLGYRILTSYEINTSSPSGIRKSKATSEGVDLMEMTYNQAATIYRINLGWRRSREDSQKGFLLDVNSGYWERNENENLGLDEENEEVADRPKRVIPYVEDRKNILLINPSVDLEEGQLITLMFALKQGIQAVFQLEDNELAVEALPDPQTPSQIMLFESAEGGAGVLRKLTEDPSILKKIAIKSLEICHFDETGDDLGHSPLSKERCVQACYHCLLSYSNQPFHDDIDRHEILEFLLQLADANLTNSPSALSREEHLQKLLEQCESELEKEWLRFLDSNRLNLPDKAQHSIQNPNTRPDFYYENRVAVYVDGPVHDYPDRKERDQEQTETMHDFGYTVVRFAHNEDWLQKIQEHPSTFGNPQQN